MTLGLCLAVSDRVRLDTADKRGVTEGDRLAQVWRSTGKRPRGLDRAEVPEPGLHVWEWFWELRHAKGSGLSGPEPLGFGDIKAFSELAGVGVEPWEVRALRAMDREYVRAVAGMKDREPERKKGK